MGIGTKTATTACGMFFTFMLIAGCNQSTRNNRKVLEVKEIEHTAQASLEEASRLLEERTELHAIDVVNWNAYTYRPEVKFRIAHSRNQIWLKFYVTEENILAKHTETNSATHKDSCVEFFIDPQQDGNYYNFEFNCIGTIHLAHGPNIRERQFVDPALIEKRIKILSSLGNLPFEERTGGHSWEMTILIPAEIFVYDKPIELSDIEASANFYKCGDDTSIRHYLSWNAITTEKPNFHQPTFFGKLNFE